MDQGMKIGPQTGPAQAGAAPDRKKTAEKAAESFESFFLFNLLKEMGKTATFGEKDFREQTEMSLLYEKAADCLAKRGIGIKDVIMKYLMRTDAKVLGANGEHKKVGGSAP